jgi:hypothetical protein
MSAGRALDQRLRETSLYRPVKRFLEARGFHVKGEICGCDLVALRGEEPPLVVIAELKLQFSLELLLQAIDRTAACDEIWLAVRMRARRGRERDAKEVASPAVTAYAGTTQLPPTPKLPERSSPRIRSTGASSSQLARTSERSSSGLGSAPAR